MLPTGADLKQIPASVRTAVKVSQARRPKTSLAKRFSTLTPSVLPLSNASCLSQFRNSHNIYDFKSWISTIVQLTNEDFPLTPWPEVNVEGGPRYPVDGTINKKGAKKAEGPQQWLQPPYTPANRMNFSGTLSCGWNRKSTDSQKGT